MSSEYPIKNLRIRICSDGSVHEGQKYFNDKKPGGCSAIVEVFDGDDLLGDKSEKISTWGILGGEEKTTIGRMELLGVVLGLKFAANMVKTFGFSFSKLEKALEVFSQRNASIVRSDINKKRAFDVTIASYMSKIRPGDVEVELITDSTYVSGGATGAIKRKIHQDLWSKFKRYGSVFKSVSIDHRPRNSIPSMALADSLAREARVTIKDSIENNCSQHVLKCLLGSGQKRNLSREPIVLITDGE